MKAKGDEGTSGGSEPTRGGAAEELPERWSVQCWPSSRSAEIATGQPGGGCGRRVS